MHTINTICCGEVKKLIRLLENDINIYKAFIHTMYYDLLQIL